MKGGRATTTTTTSSSTTHSQVKVPIIFLRPGAHNSSHHVSHSTLPITPMADRPNKNTNVLHYNVRWMDSVFKSKNTTEALLSPQREAGNLTAHDYDASINFLPGYHRHYPVCHQVAPFFLPASSCGIPGARRSYGNNIGLPVPKSEMDPVQSPGRHLYCWVRWLHLWKIGRHFCTLQLSALYRKP